MKVHKLAMLTATMALGVAPAVALATGSSGHSTGPPATTPASTHSNKPSTPGPLRQVVGRLPFPRRHARNAVLQMRDRHGEARKRIGQRPPHGVQGREQKARRRHVRYALQSLRLRRCQTAQRQRGQLVRGERTVRAADTFAASSTSGHRGPIRWAPGSTQLGVGVWPRALSRT